MAVDDRELGEEQKGMVGRPRRIDRGQICVRETPIPPNFSARRCPRRCWSCGPEVWLSRLSNPAQNPNTKWAETMREWCGWQAWKGNL